MTIYGLRQTFQESVSAVTATKSVDLDLGTIRYEGGRVYQYVYNKGTTAASPGYGMCLSAATGFSVTVSSVTGVDACFGVVYNATLTTNTYGWIVKQGFVPLEAHADSILAVGDFVVLGSAGVCSRKQTAATAVDLITAQPAFGQVAQATASGGSAYGYVNCL
jgi:hypothetical protein